MPKQLLQVGPAQVTPSPSYGLDVGPAQVAPINLSPVELTANPQNSYLQVYLDAFHKGSQPQPQPDNSVYPPESGGADPTAWGSQPVEQVNPGQEYTPARAAIDVLRDRAADEKMKRAARVEHYNQVQQRMRAGLPVDHADVQWMQQIHERGMGMPRGRNIANEGTGNDHLIPGIDDSDLKGPGLDQAAQDQIARDTQARYRENTALFNENDIEGMAKVASTGALSTFLDAVRGDPDIVPQVKKQLLNNPKIHDLMMRHLGLRPDVQIEAPKPLPEGQIPMDYEMLPQADPRRSINVGPGNGTYGSVKGGRPLTGDTSVLTNGALPRTIRI